MYSVYDTENVLNRRTALFSRPTPRHDERVPRPAKPAAARRSCWASRPVARPTSLPADRVGLGKLSELYQKSVRRAPLCCAVGGRGGAAVRERDEGDRSGPDAHTRARASKSRRAGTCACPRCRCGTAASEAQRACSGAARRVPLRVWVRRCCQRCRRRGRESARRLADTRAPCCSCVAARQASDSELARRQP